ncbi:MAG: PIN domain-containing protein [Leptospiraceae bacterium]|nr:PIN domain-containing protein [Leptospiraceae bacterium]
MIFLDTCIIIDLLRNDQRAKDWLLTLNNPLIVISGQVQVELIQGCNNKIEFEKTLKFISKTKIQWATKKVYKEATETFMKYKLSHNISFVDAVIAHQAKSLILPIITRNVKDFKLVDGIDIIVPYYNN